MNESDRRAVELALHYMGLEPGKRIEDIGVDRVFIGSCTNSRIEDLRSAARVAKGHHVSSKVRAMVVPGSQTVKRAAEKKVCIGFSLKLALNGGSRDVRCAWA